MNKISLNLIVGQQPEQYLEYALKSTLWADEHVIINTGEKENPNIGIITNILAGRSLKLLHYKNYHDKFDFSSARNIALNNSSNEWILWQDSDEVHFELFERIARQLIQWKHYQGFQFEFYHFLLDLYHYQSKDPRVILFQKAGKKWIDPVHEHVEPMSNVLIMGDYKYHHYGYTKPQHEIYRNWRLYWSLNPGEEFKLKENRNPDDIISDRVTVAQPYNGPYPEVIQNYIFQQKPKVKDYKFL